MKAGDGGGDFFLRTIADVGVKRSETGKENKEKAESRNSE